MKFKVAVNTEAAIAFINAHYDIGRDDDMKGIVQLRNGKVIAAIVYDEYNGQNVFAHIASDGSKKWITRHFLYEGFHYPFVTLGCQRITGWVEANNTDSRRFLTNLGFTAEALLEKAGRDGVDVILYRMFRQECRYA